MGEYDEGNVQIPLRGVQDDAEPQKCEKVKQYLIALAACLGAFTAGTVLSWTSPALDMLAANGTINGTTSILTEPITKDEGGWVGSLMAIGALIGAFPTGILCDRIGRKWTILGLGGPFILSWILIFFASGPGLLYVARIFAGMGTGGACVAIPMYVGEIAESSVRGALGSMFQLLLTVGILYEYVLGSFGSYVWLNLLSGLAAVIFVVAVFFVPESPNFLLKVGKKKEAEESLRTLRGPNYNVKPELNIIQEDIDTSERNKASFKDLFSSKANVNGLIVGLLLMVFQQLSGINAVIFYSGPIFKDAGSSLDPAICSIIIGVVQVIATFVATVLVDRAGRRLLLLLSASVMCICLIALGVYFHMKDADEASVANIGMIPLLSLTLFIVAFSLGFGPLPWMMMAEIFAPAIKSNAAAIAVMLNWTLTFVVTKTFEDLKQGMGTAPTFWMFSAITALGILFVFFRVPETKGKTFAEIQEQLGSR